MVNPHINKHLNQNQLWYKNHQLININLKIQNLRDKAVINHNLLQKRIQI